MALAVPPKEKCVPDLTIDALIEEAAAFAAAESAHGEPTLYGVDNGKIVGTYLEQKFARYVSLKYDHDLGNSASGIDFPGLGVDVKATSVQLPQSSCPYRSARQKIYGLGYSLLVFVYAKSDDDHARTACLDMRHAVFVDRSRTADFQTTRGILDIIGRDGNEDDLIGFFGDRNLPVDEIEAANLARDVLRDPPNEGYLTISNALQWRLKYSRAITKAGTVDGVIRVR